MRKTERRFPRTSPLTPFPLSNNSRTRPCARASLFEVEIAKLSRGVSRRGRGGTPGQETPMGDVVPIQVDPPPRASGWRHRTQGPQWYSHFGRPDLGFFIHLDHRLKTAVPFQIFRRAAYFKVNSFAVGRHLELKVMFEIVEIAADERLDDVLLPKPKTFLRQPRRIKGGPFRERAFVAQIQITIRPERSHGR